MTARTLAIAFFPRAFCGEAAQFEVGLHRLPAMAPPGWGVEWLQLDAGDPERSVRAVADAAPDLLLLHANRTQMVETVAFLDALADHCAALPVLLCGWIAQPAYIDEAFAACAPAGLRHPRFALACGEVEAVVPAALARLQDAVDLERLAGLPGVVRWDSPGRAWVGRPEFVCVEEMDRLPVCTIDHIRKEWRDADAGWVELSRGCRLRCSFCFVCCYARPRMRRVGLPRLRAGIEAAAAKGVKVLGLYTASVSLDIELVRGVVDAFRDLGLRDVAVVGAMGPVGRKFLSPAQLDLLGALRWSVMTVGLQSITPAATRLARRMDDPERFAATMERIAGFVTPEVELILGLPGDSPEAFRRTIEFALALPVNVTVQTFRLDPWSTYFAERELHGLRADFRNVARVYESAAFPGRSIEECRAWLRSLGQGPWRHRAKNLALDGQQLNGRGGRPR
jgi:hypothetical protein